MKELSCGFIIVNKKNPKQILACQPNGRKANCFGNYDIPKGHIEKGESVLDAAIRECFEETNEVITKDNYVNKLNPFEITFINHYNKLVKKIIYPLIFRVDKIGELAAKEDRIKKVKYLPIGEFLLKCTYDNVKTMIMEAISK